MWGNCKYKKYENGKILCECLVDNGDSDDEEGILDQIIKELRSFGDLINFDVMYCHDLVFNGNKNSYIKNIGFMIFCIIFIIFLVCFFVSFYVVNKKLKEMMNRIDRDKEKLKNMINMIKEEEKKKDY